MQASIRAFVRISQRDALRFAEADVSSSSALTWATFLSVQPSAVRQSHTEAEMRAWFEALSGAGESVSVSTWFLWTLLKEVQHDTSCTRLKNVFNKYDRCANGGGA